MEENIQLLSVRRLALTALEGIWLKARLPKETIEELAHDIEQRDRAFLMELVYGVLRYRDTIDWILRDFLKNPKGLGFHTINNLRLGVYQILYMRVPDWASVNEAVNMENSKPSQGLVNAVLRNVIRNKEALESKLKGLKEKISEEGIEEKIAISSISVFTSHPEWLIKRWVARFGMKEALALAEANNKIPPITLRINTLKSTVESVLERLSDLNIKASKTRFSPEGITLDESQSFMDLKEIEDLMTVQDEAAQLITHLLDPKQGERILDACAAPGGKTTHMAELIKDSGEIVAVDNNPVRLKRLKDNIDRLGLKSIKTIKTDILRFNPDVQFDRILLDAPCTSIGVIRRNPDVKYRHKPEDLKKSKALQIQMLQSVSGMLKKGGALVYCTCSTEADEGEEVIENFLRRNEDFYIIKTHEAWAGDLSKQGFMRTYPHKDGLDGFFGVRLCKD